MSYLTFDIFSRSLIMKFKLSLFQELNLDIPPGTSKLRTLEDRHDPWMLIMAVGEPGNRREESDSRGGKNPEDPDKRCTG